MYSPKTNANLKWYQPQQQQKDQSVAGQPYCQIMSIYIGKLVAGCPCNDIYTHTHIYLNGLLADIGMFMSMFGRGETKVSNRSYGHFPITSQSCIEMWIPTAMCTKVATFIWNCFFVVVRTNLISQLSNRYW